MRDGAAVGLRWRFERDYDGSVKRFLHRQALWLGRAPLDGGYGNVEVVLYPRGLVRRTRTVAICGDHIERTHLDGVRGVILEKIAGCFTRILQSLPLLTSYCVRIPAEGHVTAAAIG